MQRFTQSSIIIYSSSQRNYSGISHMSVRNILVTTTQQKYINSFQLHLLVFNTCYAKDRFSTVVNIHPSTYDRSHKKCHSFLMTGNIHYPPEGAVQELTFTKFFQTWGKEKTCQLNNTQEKASQSRNRSWKQEVFGRCKREWGQRQNTSPNLCKINRQVRSRRKTDSVNKIRFYNSLSRHVRQSW
jgi:hypothetical protein